MYRIQPLPSKNRFPQVPPSLPLPEAGRGSEARHKEETRLAHANEKTPCEKPGGSARGLSFEPQSGGRTTWLHRQLAQRRQQEVLVRRPLVVLCFQVWSMRLVVLQGWRLQVDWTVQVSKVRNLRRPNPVRPACIQISSSVFSCSR